jgi:hypothetical protein
MEVLIRRMKRWPLREQQSHRRVELPLKVRVGHRDGWRYSNSEGREKRLLWAEWGEGGAGVWEQMKRAGAGKRKDEVRAAVACSRPQCIALGVLPHSFS